MNTAYRLYPIAVAVLMLYFLSHFLAKQHILSIKTHRKIWNAALLATFLVSGLTGLYLVVKANYKIEAPFTETLLKWHVEFGIAMAIVSIFHLSWHLKYYLKLFQPSKKNTQSDMPDGIGVSAKTGTSRRFYVASAFLLGFTSLVTQMVLLREFMAIFDGNELIITIIITNWMVIVAAGAYLGKYAHKVGNMHKFTLMLLVLVSVLPIVIAFFANFSKNQLFPVGSMISLYQTLGLSFLLLLPYCLVSGIAFTLFANALSAGLKKNVIRRVYAIESFGSVAGGLVLGFVLVYFFSNLIVLVFILLADLLFVVYFAARLKEKKIVYLGLDLAAIAIVGLSFRRAAK